VVQGNSQHGLQAAQGAVLRISNTTFERNRLFGIFCFSCHFAQDLLKGNHFGSKADGTANKLDMLVRTQVRAVVLDEYGQPQKDVHVRVYSTVLNVTVPLLDLAAAPNATVATGFLTPYVPDAKTLASSYLGPFRYEVWSPAMAQPESGTLDTLTGVVVGHVSVNSPSPGVRDWTSLGLLGVGVGMIVVGLLWKPITKGFRKLRAPRP
ncbi:MAG: hypothetical protein QOI63_815, partial [Thermoplasmata archaeon]|nr:hypothetical protein [Thermoplasmata archaeon]